MPESYTNPCACVPIPGTTPPDIAPYVVSLNNLEGLVTIAADGGVSVRSQGNVIYIGANGSAGLGTVTSVAATSSNTNLVIGGSPVTTTGTFAFSLAGALNSISGLTTAADKMIYTTASNTYAVTDLTSFARTILDDANAAASRTTLGLVIGTDVQAFSQDLADFVTNASWTGTALTLAGNLTCVNLNCSSFTSTGTFSFTGTASFTGSVVANNFSGDGSQLTALHAGELSAGTVAVARGGTNIGSYAIGDLIYASGATTLSKLADVAAGSYLRSGGVTTAPAWSTLILPNSSTTGDILMSTSSNTIGVLANVATGNVLLSGGVGVASSFGKVTSSHVNSTIATIASGVNANITSFSSAVTFNDNVTIGGLGGVLTVAGVLRDGSGSDGTANQILTSTSSDTAWSSQITLDTITINTRVSVEGTLTPGGTTGAQTINKPSGTVRFAAAASSLTVTNSLCTTSDRVLACVCTNDATAYVKNVVTTTGAFTIILGAAATAETEVYWELIRVS